MRMREEYSKGIGHFLRAVYVMEPAAQGTNVTIYFGWIPRNVFMRILRSRETRFGLISGRRFKRNNDSGVAEKRAHFTA